ncbi:MAG TPA: metallophosphoesterase, partial [Polyangiaceae bacterium]|nr:metallophosphoesterase [Polyangiaceae bacterium]
LTQRAKPSQFEAARAFLARLPCRRQLVVPGNHDVPLWNPVLRVFSPRARFDQYLTPDPFPTVIDRDVAIVGLDTARSPLTSHGRVNMRQIEGVLGRFRDAPHQALRVLACHHPFVLPADVPGKRPRRSDTALAALVQYEVDLLLTGHRHLPWVSPLGTDLLTVHAGTSTSSRTRGVENSFNEIIVDRDSVTIRRFLWRAELGTFVVREDATERAMRNSEGRVHRRPVAAGQVAF